MDHGRESWGSSVYCDPPYDDQCSPMSESTLRRVRSSRRWNQSVARSSSRLFDVLECDALEESVDDKLRTSRLSSKRSSSVRERNSGLSSRSGIPIQGIADSFVFSAEGRPVSQSMTSTPTSKST